jgi:hypothetical protein
MAGRTTGHNHLNNRFTDGNPGQGVMPTVIDAAWLNDKQEEIVKMVEAAGITPDIDTQSQLLDAVKHFIATENEGGKSYSASDIMNLYTAGVVANPLDNTGAAAKPVTADGNFDRGIVPLHFMMDAKLSKITVYGSTGAADGAISVNFSRINVATGATDYLGGANLTAGETSEEFVPAVAYSTVNFNYMYLATVECKASVSVNNAIFYGFKVELAYP